MKTKTTIFGCMIALLLFSSCVPTQYYQLYKTTASEKIDLKENVMVYEDSNCIISYNLWQEGGNIGFRFFNKTDNNIYLNLEESFFILNGVANNYYKNRVFTNSSGGIISKTTTGYNYFNLFQMNSLAISNTASNVTSSGYSIAYNEEKTICIPSKTSKVVAEYKINESLFRDCDLLKYPSKKQIKPKSFTKSNSPIVFSNRLLYKIGQNEKLIKVENEFFVSEITNLPKSEMFVTKYEEFCGKKSNFPTEISKENAPNKFYIEYGGAQYGAKH